MFNFCFTSDDHLSAISVSSDSLPESPEFCSWVNDLGLSVADEQILLNGRWLTATHMSAANCLLRSQFPTQNGLQDTCRLKQRGIWSSTPDRFVQIIHVSSDHWACLSNKFSSLGHVDLFDSMHTVPVEDGTICTQVCSILQTPKPTISTSVVNVGHQEGTSDCGLLAIAMAYDLCAGVDPVTREYVQSELRNHLHSCFNNKLLKPFPSTVCNIEKRTLYIQSHSMFTANVECQKEKSGWFVVISATSGTMRVVSQSQLRCATTNGTKFLGNALNAKKVHVQ